MTGPYRVAVDGSGNIFVANDTNGTLPGQVWTRQLGTIYEDVAKA